MRSNVKKIIISLFAILIATFMIITYVIFLASKPSDLKFYVFDIGQGDAMLIRTPSHHNILIDGGPDNSVVYKLGEYLPFYDRTIDLMILSHPHTDHLAGLNEVLARYKVKHILTTGIFYKSAFYAAWLNSILEKNIFMEIVTKSKKIFLGETELNIILPNQNYINQEIKNLNNASIVIKLNFASTSIMLTGDYEDEESLVGVHDLNADILKVGHHGSHNANSFEFLSAVNPAYATISSGVDNKFGHPHLSTLNDLSSLEVKVFNTALAGDIIFSSDGEVITYYLKNK
ncbi:MAG: hypothetical protein CMI53_05385 [Parcubacteria group bacterium]|nr:hypothetical protein [Parcubacteria group bacterium]|tara:strand:+ start:13246 stop:14109 length:864 start_codon:yes stop_codon:yes gene_type:complete